MVWVDKSPAEIHELYLKIGNIRGLKYLETVIDEWQSVVDAESGEEQSNG